MRLLIVVHNFVTQWVGGVEVYTRDLATSLETMGVEVTVLYPGSAIEGNGARLVTERPRGPRILRLESSFGDKFGLTSPPPAIEEEFLSLLRRERFDNIHFQHTWCRLPFSLLPLAKQTGTPVFLTLHDFWFACARTNLFVPATDEICSGPDSVTKCADCLVSEIFPSADPERLSALKILLTHRSENARNALDACDLVTAPSRFLIDRLADFGFPVDTIELAPLGIQPVQVCSTPTKSPIRFSFLGSLSPLKNPVGLARTFCRISGQASLCLRGDTTPETTRALEQISAEDPRVHYGGPYTPGELPGLLRDADVLVMPSKLDVYPLVVREALSAGVPVLASRVGGIPEIIEHGVNGILFDPDRPDELIEWMERLSSDPSLVESLRRQIEPPKTILQDAAEWKLRYEAAGRDQIAGNSDSPAGSPSISFCIITAGARPELLKTVIRSIRAQKIERYEIIIVGRHRQDPGTTYIPAESCADQGRLGEMRNLAVAAARFENIVLLDDDIVLAPGWYQGFRSHAGDFDILTSQVRLPDGGRYWDHASFGGSNGHRILTEDEDDCELYMTGGGGWIMKQKVARAVRWDPMRGFYESEDLDFAAACRARGFRITHEQGCVVFHADPSYTTVGRVVVRRQDERTSAWVAGEIRGLSVPEIGRRIAEHLREGRIAEAADYLRYSLGSSIGQTALAQAWRELEALYGGPLPEARWTSGEDTEYRQVMELYRGAPEAVDVVPEASLGTEQRARAAASPSLAINLFGFLSGNLGLGLASRSYLKLLLESGIQVHAIDLPAGGGRSDRGQRESRGFASLDEPTPHGINFFAANPSDVKHIAQHFQSTIQLDGRINLCAPFWELPKIPIPWLEVLESMDVVVAATQFIRYSLLADLSGVSVPYSPLPLYLEPDICGDRARWRIPVDALTFVCSFEMASDVNRKNPFAVIRAFEHAFGSHENTYLVVKVNNSRSFSGFEKSLHELRQRAHRNSHIILVDESLQYRDVLSLYSSCDVFVSLHRAEGLGLCLLEAMSLGKPVIATAWSGNMDYMTEQNSCLVGYSLVPVEAGTQPAYAKGYIGRDVRWADPDRHQAAAWMRRLAGDQTLRERIGKQAAADMADRHRRRSSETIEASIRAAIDRRSERSGRPTW